MQLLKVSVLLLLVVLSAGSPATSTQAQGMLQVIDPFARATPGGVKNGAAYLLLKNPGKTPRVLVGVNSDVAAHVAMHRSVMSNGMMHMTPVSQLTIPAHSSVQFKPGSYHIMLMGLKKGLVEGSHFQLVLYFKNAPEQRVEVQVRGIGAMPLQ